MRKKLSESKKEAATRDAFRSLRSSVEKLFWMLRNSNTSAATGTGGDTVVSGFSVPKVASLPPIPSTGYSKVYWTSSDGGTGDDQPWDTYTGQSRWYPCQKPTTLAGTPGV